MKASGSSLPGALGSWEQLDQLVDVGSQSDDGTDCGTDDGDDAESGLELIEWGGFFIPAEELVGTGGLFLVFIWVVEVVTRALVLVGALLDDWSRGAFSSACNGGAGHCDCGSGGQGQKGLLELHELILHVLCCVKG